MHSPIIISKMLLRPLEKVTCLFRFKTKVACVKMDVKSMTGTPVFHTLAWDALQAYEDRNALEALAVSENGGNAFPGSAIFLPAPFLSNSVNKADTNDCFGLIRILVATATAFDM